MSLVIGDNVFVLTYDNGGWRLYACAKSCTLSVSTSMVETSTTGSGDYATYEPQKHGITGTLDGVVDAHADNMLTLADLRQRQLSKQRLLMRFTRTDTDGNVYTDECYFFITNTTDNGPFGEMATFTVELQGTGALTQIFTPTSYLLSAVKRYPAVDDTTAASGGETSFTIALLIGKDVLAVHKDGIGNCAIITTGSPVDKQVLYESTTGTFTWYVEFEPGETYYILYQDI